MSRKFNSFHDEDEQDEENSSWLDSYSDLVTDLLAVFVILFSFAMMNQAAVANSAKNQAKADSAAASSEMIVPENISQSQEEIIAFNSLFDSISQYIIDEHLENELSVEKIENSQILLRVDSSVFFDPGQADFHENSAPILESIAELFLRYEETIQMIRIEGHTDNIPMNTAKYNSNWELSTGRAVNVLKEMLDLTELDPEKFSAVGYSEFYPIASNDTAEGRSQNRRVDFFIESIISEE